MEKTHWKKKFNYDYLGSYSLEDGKDLILTIDHVKTDKVKGTNGRDEECLVCSFKEDQKPMILNRTNCKTIEQLYKTAFIEEWTGRKVQVYVAHNISAFGDTVDALRIRPKIPQEQLPLLTNQHKKAWNRAIEIIHNGEDISIIKEHFTLTQDTIDQLNKEANE